MSAFRFNIRALNAICVQFGGAGGHVRNLAAMNEICRLRGGTGGHLRHLDALNEWAVLEGGTGAHRRHLAALGEIAARHGATVGDRRILAALSAIAAELDVAPDPEPEPAGGPSPVLLVVAGQSNARKAGVTAPPAGVASVADSFIWSVAGAAFVPYAAGVNSGHQGGYDGGAWGSEAAFIARMNAEHPGRVVYVVKEAVNGQALAPVGGGDWAPGSAGERFAGLERQVADARARLAADGIALGDEVVAWNQGEADAGDPEAAAAYGANLSAFIAAVRTRISGDALFVAERIRPWSGDLAAAPYAGTFAVREGTLDAVAADGNATAIDTDFAPEGFAVLHPGNDWAIGCGERVYASWAGSYDVSFGSILDHAPDAFAFDDRDGVAPGATVTSGILRPTGFQRAAPVSVTGGEYRVIDPDDGIAADWSAAAGWLCRWQKVQLRQVAAARPATAAQATLSVGGVVTTWTVTTEAATASREPETDAFLSALDSAGAASMSAAQSAAVDRLVADLKAAGLFTPAKIVRLYLGALHDEIAARTDLMNPGVHMVQSTAGGAVPVSWTVGQGWNPQNVNNSGLDCGASPAALTGQNSAGLFVWLGALSDDPQFDLVSADGTFGLRVLTGSARALVHAGSNQNFAGLSLAPGFYAAQRTTASATTLYGPDGTALATNGAASVTPTATSLWLGAGGGAGGTADRPVRAHGLTCGLTSAETRALRDALATFLATFSN